MQGWMHKDKDKDLKLVLKESLRTRTRINITAVIIETRRRGTCNVIEQYITHVYCVIYDILKLKRLATR